MTKNNKVEEADIDFLEKKVNELIEYCEIDKPKIQAILGYCDTFKNVCDRFRKSIILQVEEGVDVVEIIRECKRFVIGKCPKCNENVYSDIDAEKCEDCGTKLIWKGE
jgi:hypothetical protein